MGHSQGCAKATGVAKSYNKQLGGIVGLMGSIGDVKQPKTIENENTPFLLILGAKDDIVKSENIKNTPNFKKYSEKKEFVCEVFPEGDHMIKKECYERIVKFVN